MGWKKVTFMCFLLYNTWGNKVLYKGLERELEVNQEINIKARIVTKYFNGATTDKEQGTRGYTQ